jgi:hypothetical protein
MKSVIPIVSILILFAGSAAGSWYLYASKEKEPEAQAPPATAMAKVPPSPPLPSSEQEDDEQASSDQLPVAVHPRPISAEDIYRFGSVIRNREEVLKNREERLERQENRVKLMFEDIRAEQVELEALQAKIQSQVESAEALLAQISTEKQEADQIRSAAAKEREEYKKSQMEIDESQVQNVRKMAEWFQNMDADKAAEYLRELANDGKLSMAVQLLSNFEERDAAEILAAMDDPALVIQLTEELKTLKRPEKKKR